MSDPRTPAAVDAEPGRPVPAPERERLALALWLLVAGLQIAVSFLLGGDSSTDSDDEPFYSYSLAVGSLLIYAILIALTFWIAALYPDRRAALGLRRFAPRLLWLVAGAVIVSVLVSALLEPVLPAGEEQGLQPDEWRPERVGAFVVNGIVVSTLVPFAEELFYRGLGCRAFLLFGPLVSVVATSVLFALAHGILVAIPALGVFGLLLGWLRMRSDSVWPCVIAHGIYNAVGVIAFYVTATS